MDPHDSNRVRHVVGCMTGTSLDGLDVALVRIEGGGLEMKASFLGLHSNSLGDLADTLRHFAEGRAAPPIDYMRAARQLGELHAKGIEELCKTHLPTSPGDAESAPKLDFIVAHGQTIWHAPGKAGKQESTRAENEVTESGLSWQLFDPWPLVQRLKVPVCHDLRQADLIAGGQGAPITPLADWIMYGRGRGIINLGGICNVSDTVGEVGDIRGSDVCPCNILIDGVVRALFPSVPFDKDGRIAASGQPIREAVERFHEAIINATRGKASLGREDFGETWIRELINDIGPSVDGRDMIAAAIEAVARRIAFFALSNDLHQLVLAGGGTRNPVLVDRIRRLCDHTSPDKVVRSDDLGIPSEAREAMAFAVLGALSQDGVVITLPQVTGADNPGRAGTWAYP